MLQVSTNPTQPLVDAEPGAGGDRCAPGGQGRMKSFVLPAFALVAWTAAVAAVAIKHATLGHDHALQALQAQMDLAEKRHAEQLEAFQPEVQGATSEPIEMGSPAPTFCTQAATTSELQTLRADAATTSELENLRGESHQCSLTGTLPLAWQLLVHQDLPHLFSSSTEDSFTENTNDPNGGAYMIVGDIDHNKTRYLSNGKYIFKLVYENAEYSSDADCGPAWNHNVTLIWEQTSWLTSYSIEGFRPIDVPAGCTRSGLAFTGLGRSTNAAAVFDGDGSANRYWWNSVGVISLHQGGMPAFDVYLATKAKLYIAVMEVLKN